MPSKTERSIGTLLFPKSGPVGLQLDVLPRNKEQIEQEIVRRFLMAYGDIEGEPLECAGRAPEPGDVEVIRRSGESVYVQLGEVVDTARIRASERRKEYAAVLWGGFVALREAYSGVMVAVHDVGGASQLPRLQAPNGRGVLQGFADILESLVPIVQSLPLNETGRHRGKETSRTLNGPEGPAPFNFRLVRYAPEKSAPLKWLWTSSFSIAEPNLDSGFTDLLKKKILKYGRISNPFWLVLYSIDCLCDETEHAKLLAQLGEASHPFQKVFLFLPRMGIPGEIKQLHPAPEAGPPQANDRRKLLARFFPEDALPGWDDPRWETIE